MTINGSTGALEWATELTGEDPKQLWTITDHRTPAATGLMEITANVPGVGNFTMAVDGRNRSAVPIVGGDQGLTMIGSMLS